jgi:predicted nucleotidyltransferase
MTNTQVENTLISILKKHDVERIGIFGSRARGEARPDSDLDVLVDFNKVKSLLTLVSIEQELTDALGIKVDLLTESAISPHLINRIKAELKVVYQ